MTTPVSERALAVLLLVAGGIGFLAAAMLLGEKIAILADPEHEPSCTISPILNCGSIMRTDQAEVFGFPNPILGVAAFPVVVTTGAVLLAGAARLARWYWLGLQAGVTFALGFIGWLAFQSLYRIGALCPYCMVVWAAVLPLFWYVTLRNLGSGALGERVRESAVVRGLMAWHAPILLAAYLLPIVLIAIRFWSYWSTLV
ncbi:vitamin K epoxide reductase family protein [Nocardioides hungaricus]